MTQKWDSTYLFLLLCFFNQNVLCLGKQLLGTVVGYCYGTLKNKKVKASSVVSFAPFYKNSLRKCYYVHSKTLIASYICHIILTVFIANPKGCLGK